MSQNPKTGGERFSFEEQDRLDKSLVNIAPALRAWNDMLKDKFYDVRTAPDCSMGELKTKAEEHLDSLWPHQNDVINVTGIMYDTDILRDEDGSILSTKISRKEVAGAFRSNGFSVMTADPDAPPVACLSFITGSGRYPLQGAEAWVTTIGYVMPEEASLMVVEKPDKEHELATLIESLEQYNHRIRKDIYKNKTPFMSYEQNRQQEILSDVEQEASRLFVVDGYALKVDIEAIDYVYTASTIEEDIHQIDTKDMVGLQGEVLGVCILESLIAPDGAIRSSRDFLDTTAGLCLMVDVGDMRFGKNLILVPSARAESIKFSL